MCSVLNTSTSTRVLHSTVTLFWGLRKGLEWMVFPATPFSLIPHTVFENAPQISLMSHLDILRKYQDHVELRVQVRREG